MENSVVCQVENISQTDTSKFVNFVDKPIVRSFFYKWFFDGSKSNDGGVGCILVSPEVERTMLACRLEFDCINKIVEYEALVHGMYKAIGLNIKHL